MFINRLYIYTAHVNPALPHPYEAVEFIEEGFNLKAFIFTGLWAFYHRIWSLMIAIIAFNIFLGVIAYSGINPISLFALQLGVNALIGFSANDWRRKNLSKKGFIVADIVTGGSTIAAQQRFFDRYFSLKNNVPFVGIN